MSLSRVGCVIDYNALMCKLKNKGIHKIRSIFTIVTIGHNNSRKTITSFRVINSNSKKNKLVVIPRFGGFMLQDIKLLDNVINNLPGGTNIQFKDVNITLTKNQSTVLNYLNENVYNTDNIKTGKSSTILQMNAGYGKTYLSMGVINTMKKKTFIIVPNTYLLKQWVNILETTFPNNTIGMYCGKYKTDGDIIVSIINSALKYPCFDNIGLVIYDEVHMYCSSKFAKIFETAQSKLCLGITATPTQRLDKFDLVSQWALGKIIYSDKINGWDPQAVNFKTSVTRIIYNGHKDYTKILESAAGIISVPLMVNQLQSDPYRNKIIIKYAIELYNMGRNIFVFSDRRGHLHDLAKCLSELKIRFDAPELTDDVTYTTDDTTDKKIEGITELMGGSTDENIEYAKKTGRIILTTFQYSGTGVSINKMNSLILATPRKSNMEQILGRIYRLSSDATVERHIIDLVDNRTCLKSQYYSRKKVYINHLHSEIKDITINWDDVGI